MYYYFFFGNNGFILQATDADQTSSISYVIVSGERGFFSINRATGVISVTSPLDYETRNSYTLVISTEDGRGQVNQNPDAQTIVNVNVLVCITLSSYDLTISRYMLTGFIMTKHPWLSRIMHTYFTDNNRFVDTQKVTTEEL